jgi:hypothetical protein
LTDRAVGLRLAIAGVIISLGVQRSREAQCSSSGARITLHRPKMLPSLTARKHHQDCLLLKSHAYPSAGRCLALAHPPSFSTWFNSTTSPWQQLHSLPSPFQYYVGRVESLWSAMALSGKTELSKSMPLSLTCPTRSSETSATNIRQHGNNDVLRHLWHVCHFSRRIHTSTQIA